MMMRERIDRIYDRISRAGYWLNPILIPLVVILMVSLLALIAYTLVEDAQRDEERAERSRRVVAEALDKINNSAEERSLRHDEADAERIELLLAEIRTLREEVHLLHTQQHVEAGQPPPANPVPPEPPHVPRKERVGVPELPPISDPPRDDSEPKLERRSPDRTDGCSLSLLGACIVK